MDDLTEECVIQKIETRKDTICCIVVIEHLGDHVLLVNFQRSIFIHITFYRYWENSREHRSWIVIDTSVGVGVISDSFPRIVIDTSVGVGVMSDSFHSLYGIKIFKHKTNNYTPPLTWMTTSRQNNNNVLIRYVKSPRVPPDDGLLFPEGITWWRTIIPRGYQLMTDY